MFWLTKRHIRASSSRSALNNCFFWLRSPPPVCVVVSRMFFRNKLADIRRGFLFVVLIKQWYFTQSAIHRRFLVIYWANVLGQPDSSLEGKNTKQRSDASCRASKWCLRKRRIVYFSGFCLSLLPIKINIEFLHSINVSWFMEILLDFRFYSFAKGSFKDRSFNGEWFGDEAIRDASTWVTQLTDSPQSLKRVFLAINWLS